MSDNRNETEDGVLNALSRGTAEEGHGAEIARIFREHHRGVLRAAYRVTGNAEDAEDVLQTIFMRLVRREGGSPLSDSPGGYLRRAAINAALDLVRAKRASRSTPLEGVEATLADPAPEDPEQARGNNELREQVRVALAKASPKAAEIFVLRYFEGYDNHEIAKMLGTSRSTVNVILHRTRNKLREEIGPQWGDES